MISIWRISIFALLRTDCLDEFYQVFLGFSIAIHLHTYFSKRTAAICILRCFYKCMLICFQIPSLEYYTPFLFYIKIIPTESKWQTLTFPRIQTLIQITKQSSLSAIANVIIIDPKCQDIQTLISTANMQIQNKYCITHEPIPKASITAFDHSSKKLLLPLIPYPVPIP